MLLNGLLLISDLIMILQFDAFGAKVLMVRLVNTFIFILTTVFMIEKDPETGLYKISSFFNNIYIYSILFISAILYGQAFGLIKFGEVFRARTYFGIQLPFNKPVGLFELSDGKLGIIIAPLIFYYIINSIDKFKFNKIRYGISLIVLLALLIVIMQSRSAYLALVIAFFFLILMFNTYKSRLLLKIGVVSSTVLYLFTNVFQAIWIGLSGEGVYAGNVSSRGTTMAFAFNKFLSSPIYGVGRSNLVYYHNTLYKDHGVGSHNLFLDHLGSGGLLSFTPLILLFGLFFYYCFKLFFISRRMRVKSQIGFSMWLIISMIYIVVELNFYRGLYNEYIYFFLGFGTIAYLNYKKLLYEENITHRQC